MKMCIWLYSITLANAMINPQINNRQENSTKIDPDTNFNLSILRKFADFVAKRPAMAVKFLLIPSPLFHILNKNRAQGYNCIRFGIPTVLV